MISKQLAAVVKRAMQIREDSYDTKAAETTRERLEGYPNAHIDFDTFYRTTMHRAAVEAAAEFGDPSLDTPVYLLMANSWSDACAYADSVLEAE